MGRGTGTGDKGHGDKAQETRDRTRDLRSGTCFCIICKKKAIMKLPVFKHWAIWTGGFGRDGRANYNYSISSEKKAKAYPERLVPEVVFLVAV
jgi:hypothetical protein